MELIPELVPSNIVTNVIYDERLPNMEFEDTTSREKVDAFWSTLFYVGLNTVERVVLSSSQLELVNYELYPVNYDLKEQTVSVIIHANVSWAGSSRVMAGYGVHAKASTDGSVSINFREVTDYSEGMKPHVMALLAKAALAYQPIETDSL